MKRRKLVVIGLLGTTLDQGWGPRRWERWRPTVSLFQHDDLIIDRLELLVPRHVDNLVSRVKDDIEQISPETVVRTHTVDPADPWDLEQVYESLFDFAQRYDFRTDEEDYLVHITTGTHIAQICVFLLTEARYFPARLVQTSPHPRGQPPGPKHYAIIDLDLSKYDRIAARFHKQQQDGLSFLKSGIDTRNASFNRLIERIEQVSVGSIDPILLTGPTGAGKSALARRIFRLRKSRQQVDGDLVEVNCATIRGDGAMSSLFGHVKGAFTGAAAARTGMLRKAHGGVLFLDEIGELGADEQAMLLRAIEQKTFYPVGSDRETRSDFQLIAGSNRDLDAAATAGRFRQDLLARINLWTFQLPGLRDRPEDIDPNLTYELDQCSQAMNRHITMSREARDRFLAFATSKIASWDGNFRDLNAAVRRMATLCPEGRIGVQEVEEEIARLHKRWKSSTSAEARHIAGIAVGATVASVADEQLVGKLDSFDLAQLDWVLRVCLESESLSDAGRKLFEVSRKRKKSTNDADRLRKYLARYGLQWRDIRPFGV